MLTISSFQPQKHVIHLIDYQNTFNRFRINLPYENAVTNENAVIEQMKMQ